MTKQNSPAVPIHEKELWTIADLIAMGVGARTTIWRLRRDDPTFPRPVVNDRFLADDIRQWLRNRRSAKAA